MLKRPRVASGYGVRRQKDSDVFERSPGDAALALPGGEDGQNPVGQGIPDFSAPRQAKAASPVSLIKQRLPFAAALHTLIEYTSEYSTPSLRARL